MQSSCTRRGADPINGCQTCEFTIQYKTFIVELEKELDNLRSGTIQGAMEWPYQMLLGIVVEVATFSSSVKRTGKDWTVVTSTLVSVYRDEIAKVKAVDNYILQQKVQDASASKAPDVDEDDNQ